MKHFEEPVIEIQKFNTEDVMTTESTWVDDNMGEWN